MILSRKQFKKSRFNYSVLNYLSLGILLLVVVVSLIQVNAGVYTSLEINQLKEEFKKLQVENELLLEKEATVKSMGSLNELSRELNMVEVVAVSYLSPSTDTLARLSR